MEKLSDQFSAELYYDMKKISKKTSCENVKNNNINITFFYGSRVLITILFHYIFITSQLWLTSHPRNTVVLLDTGTLSTSREIYSEDADGET